MGWRSTAAGQSLRVAVKKRRAGPEPSPATLRTKRKGSGWLGEEANVDEGLR